MEMQKNAKKCKFHKNIFKTILEEKKISTKKNPKNKNIKKQKFLLPPKNFDFLFLINQKIKNVNTK